MNTDDDRKALGGLVRHRRIALGLSIDSAAGFARLSATTWSAVEQGKNARDLTYGAVDRTLGWQDGSSLKYLNTRDEPSLRTNWSPIDLMLTQAVSQADQAAQQVNQLTAQLEEATDEQSRDSLSHELDAARSKMGTLNAEINRLNKDLSAGSAPVFASRRPEDQQAVDTLREYHARVEVASRDDRQRRAVLSLLRALQEDDA